MMTSSSCEYISSKIKLVCFVLYFLLIFLLLYSMVIYRRVNLSMKYFLRTSNWKSNNDEWNSKSFYEDTETMKFRSTIGNYATKNRTSVLKIHYNILQSRNFNNLPDFNNKDVSLQLGRKTQSKNFFTSTGVPTMVNKKD